jgi:uncharacterized protein (TIRG00374 family)
MRIVAHRAACYNRHVITLNGFWFGPLPGSKGQNLKKKLSFWIGMAISLLGVWLALRGVPFGELGAALSQANYWWLIPALVFHLVSVLARSERWRALLGADKVDSITAFLVMNLGYLIMNVLPLRIGDPARAVIIAQRCHVGIPRALSTVVVERVADVLAVTLGLVLLIPFMRLPPEATNAVRVFGLLGLLAIVGIIVLLWQRALAERILTAVLSRIPRISPEKWLAQWRNLMSGFDTLGSVRGVLTLVGWTVFIWATALGVFWTIMQAFFPDQLVSTVGLAAMFLLCIESLAYAVPATPGNWGVFETVARLALVAPFGLPAARAVTSAAVIHFFEYLACNLVGVMALMRYSLSLGQISAAAQQVAAPTEEA